MAGDVRSGRIKIPCGFREARIKKQPESARAILDASGRQAHLARMAGLPPTDVPPQPSCAAMPKPCSWSRPRRSWAWPWRRAGAIRPSTCSTCRPFSPRRSSPGLGRRCSRRWPRRLPTISSSPRRISPSASTIPNDIVTVFVLLFAVAVVTSQLAASVRRQARIAEAHAAPQCDHRRPGAAAADLHERAEIADVSTRENSPHIRMQCRAGRRAAASQAVLSARRSPMQLTPSDRAAAALVLDRGDRAGRGVDRAVPTEWQFHPVRSG